MLDAPETSWDFLQGGGECGRIVAAFDWSRTSLGPIAGWRSALRTAAGMVLRSPQPMVLLCGHDGLMIYNDGYGQIAGKRHPASLGARAVDAWPEIAPFNEHVIDTCLRGGVLSFRDQRLTLFRNGYAEDVWLDLTYSPVVDGSGQPEAVLAVVVDATLRHLADERLRIAQLAGKFGAFEWFPHQQRLVVSDAYRQIYGLPPDLDVTDGALLALMPPEDRHVSGNRLLGRAENPLAYAEYRIRHQVSGEIRWIARRGEILAGGADAEPRYLGVAWDITEKKRVELQDAFLASVGEKLRCEMDALGVIDTATCMLGGYLGAGRVGFAEIDPTGRIVTVERDWTDGAMPSLAGRYPLADFGQTVAEAYRQGKTVRVNDSRADSRFADKAIRQAYESIGMRAGVAVPLLRDGRLVAALYAHCAGQRRWTDAEVAVVEAVAARSWDAVQRARAEQRLRESEATFRLFAQAMPNMVWAADVGGNLYWFNDRILEYTGASEAELLREGWTKFIHPDDLAEVFAVWTQSVQDGTVYETASRLRRADGQYRWHLNRALPIRGDDGRITRWIGTNTDIEEQRRNLAELARMNALLARRAEARTRERDRIWALSRDPLLIAGSDGTWLTVSPAWSALLGWADGELVGRTAAWLTHPEDCHIAPGTIDQLNASPDGQRFESRLRTRDGQYRWFSWGAVAEGGFIYCVARDVTAEKDAAERLQQTEEALRQAQKMEAIGQLTGGIAHDFNNLLTGIIGSLDLIRRRLATGRVGDLERFMDAATTSAQRAAALTHRLLAFARRQSLDTRPVRVDALVQGMEELLRRTLGEQVRLEIDLATDCWHAMTDANQLESAVLNLAINARDAMPGGGVLSIGAENRWVDEPDPGGQRVPAELQPGGYVVLSVRDTGTGMPKSVMDKVFEPFFTTKPVGQGTGLGLSMVYGFARQSGGHVHIASEPGRGTIVTIYLPRAPEQAERSQKPQEGAAAGGGETVLVVEDNQAVRMLIVDVLTELGYQTLEASGASEAVPLLASADQIDLLVSDVGLPGLNGRQIADVARQHRPGLKILFVTGYAEDAALRSGRLAPGMSMLTKPFDIETLAAKVSVMMSGRGGG